jgi:hypothetical protein
MQAPLSGTTPATPPPEDGDCQPMAQFTASAMDIANNTVALPQQGVYRFADASNDMLPYTGKFTGRDRLMDHIRSGRLRLDQNVEIFNYEGLTEEQLLAAEQAKIWEKSRGKPALEAYNKGLIANKRDNYDVTDKKRMQDYARDRKCH